MKDLAFHLMNMCGSLKEGKFTGATILFEAEEDKKDRKLGKSDLADNYGEDSGIGEDPSEEDALMDEEEPSDFVDDPMGDEPTFSADAPEVATQEPTNDLDTSSGLPDKLYLGANANGDKNFYVVPILNDTGNLLSDIILQDQNEVPIFKASENNISLSDFSTALLQMLQVASDEYGMANLSYDVHSKWILPKIMDLQAEAQRNVVEEEVTAEESQIEQDLEDITSPEDMEMPEDEDELSSDFEIEEDEEEDKFK